MGDGKGCLAADALLLLFSEQLLVSGSLLVESEKRDNILLVRGSYAARPGGIKRPPCCFCDFCPFQWLAGPLHSLDSPRRVYREAPSVSHPQEVPSSLLITRRVGNPSRFRASTRPLGPGGVTLRRWGQKVSWRVAALGGFSRNIIVLS